MEHSIGGTKYDGRGWHVLTLVCLLAGGLIWGCGADGRGNRQVAFEAIGAPEVPWFLTAVSGIRERREVVIRNLESWEAFWTEHVSPFSQPFPMPVVDFAEEMVVGVVLGDEGSHALPSITAIRLRLADNSLMVSYEERRRRGEPGCFVTANTTQPSALVRTRRTDGPVSFEGSMRVEPCR